MAGTKCVASLSTSRSLAIPPAYTSQQCACCGHTAKENRQTQSKFECQVCGYTENADINGARNILAAGHAVLACGGRGQSGRPLKQEPTGASQARPERCRSPCPLGRGGCQIRFQPLVTKGISVTSESMKIRMCLGPRSHRAV
ncbi:TPA: transposase [Klebsiella aerogenes]|nr:transposase [Klebsiella aerogenes]